jgi:hypothetical protein
MSLDAARYAREFPSLQFHAPEAGILEIVISNPRRMNSATEAMHTDLARIWRALDVDDDGGWSSCAATANIFPQAAISA